MRKRISAEAKQAALERLERRAREKQEEDEKCRRVAATLVRLPRICRARRCRRSGLCLGSPPSCVELHRGLVMQRWPEARARILRELDPGRGRHRGA